ncbi:unnamed protein product [Pleuronectes platessa]|uniref:Uncharacterized protein n=1 Tax=Pleuronectes platessa TaxID=8262 RepID=A0A9N7TV03_PLEPL|nr:unnamed protein product [Pleuronectes platessa]
MRWCIVMHEYDFASEGTALLFVPRKKVVSQKLYVLCRGHFHTVRDPEGAYQLSPHDSGPKHDSATSLLTSQPCWDMVAIHQPSSTPSIRTIKGCTALILDRGDDDVHKEGFSLFLLPSSFADD